jgi:hypothetical protein
MSTLRTSSYNPSPKVLCELQLHTTAANATDWIVIKELSIPFVVEKLVINQTTESSIAKHISVKVGETWYNNVIQTVIGDANTEIGLLKLGLINGIRFKNSTGTTANQNLVYLEYFTVR